MAVKRVFYADIAGTDQTNGLGVAVRDNDGNMVHNNGNQAMIAMTDFNTKQTGFKHEKKNKPFMVLSISFHAMMHDLTQHNVGM
jgi:hypothetical protein